MRKSIHYMNLFLGCFLIALSLRFVLLPNGLVTFGFAGISSLIYFNNNINPAYTLLGVNLIVLFFCSFFLNKENLKQYLLPSILIPILLYGTGFLTKYFNIYLPEMMLVVIVGGALSGYGYSLIYKEGYSAGTVFLLEELIGKWFRFHSKIYTWIIDIFLLIFTTFFLGYQTMLYSLIVIIITKYMITKARFGINDSKMFFVITSKEDEVKHYIMHDLKYELTVLDVKGGFTKKKNKILFSVISTSDYYKLKEGIKLIDNKAFIAITDTYDVVNRNF